MTLRCFKRRLADTSGQSTVEFALSSLMLILVMLGVFEISRMMLIYTTVANAARAGCRWAIVHGSDATPVGTNALVKTEVQGYLGAAPMSIANANVNTSNAGSAPGSIVTVTVSYTYDPFIGFYTRFFNLTIYSTSDGVITW